MCMLSVTFSRRPINDRAPTIFNCKYCLRNETEHNARNIRGDPAQQHVQLKCSRNPKHNKNAITIICSTNFWPQMNEKKTHHLDSAWQAMQWNERLRIALQLICRHSTRTKVSNAKLSFTHPISPRIRCHPTAMGNDSFGRQHVKWNQNEKSKCLQNEWWQKCRHPHPPQCESDALNRIMYSDTHVRAHEQKQHLNIGWQRSETAGE